MKRMLTLLVVALAGLVPVSGHADEAGPSCEMQATIVQQGTLDSCTLDSGTRTFSRIDLVGEATGVPAVAHVHIYLINESTGELVTECHALASGLEPTAMCHAQTTTPQSGRLLCYLHAQVVGTGTCSARYAS